MGDLATDTAVDPLGDGRYRGALSQEWEIWGPMGGYVASVALRAAGAEATADGATARRPAAFSCHYLGVGAFGPIDVRVEARKPGRSAVAHRVELSQDGRAILDAMVWSVDVSEGLEHAELPAPDVPGHEELAEMRDLLPEDRLPPFPFWDNLDGKPVDHHDPWPPEGPLPARWREWLRFRPTAAWDDPWVDACRSVILVDLPSWPAGSRPHAWSQPAYIAPTLDLNVAFHRPTSAHDWLLCDGAAPVSTGGLLNWNARVWSPEGGLHASGGGQCLYRRTG